MPFDIPNINKLSLDGKLAIEQVLRTVAAGDFQADEKKIEALVEEKLKAVVDNSGVDDWIKSLENKTTLVSGIVLMLKAGNTVAHYVEAGSGRAEEQRSSLEQQIRAEHIAFSIPSRGASSHQQRYMADLMTLIERTPIHKIPNFKEFLGIRTIPPETPRGSVSHQARSFCQADTGVIRDISNTKALSIVYRELYSHQSIVWPEVFQQVMQMFQAGNLATHYLDSVRQGSNHLNTYRQIIFSLIFIRTLEWQLLHPTDVETGACLELEDCITRCEALENFLNNILEDGVKPELSGYTKKTPWVAYIHDTRSLIQDLRSAYLGEQLKSFSIGRLSIPAREIAIRSTDAMLKVIYRDREQGFTVKVADSLAELLKSLKRALDRDPNILNAFRPYVSALPKVSGTQALLPGIREVLNAQPETLLDLLIIFSHLTRPERGTLKHALELQARNSQGEAGLFLGFLEVLDEKYIRPLNQALKQTGKEEYQGIARRTYRAHKVATCFIGSLAVVLDAFQVKVDTTRSLRAAANSFEAAGGEESRVSVVCQNTGKYQVELINANNQSYDKESAETPPYFYPDICVFFSAEQGITDNINQLPPAINKLAGIATLFEDIDQFIDSYPNVLKKPIFLDFLKRCIDKVEITHDGFTRLFEGAQQTFGRLDGQLKCELFPIMLELRKSSKNFKLVTEEIAHVINDPQFIQGRDETFKEKVNAIIQIFNRIFNESAELEGLLAKKRRPSMYSSRHNEHFLPSSLRSVSETKESGEGASDSSDLSPFTPTSLERSARPLPLEFVRPSPDKTSEKKIQRLFLMGVVQECTTCAQGRQKEELKALNQQVLEHIDVFSWNLKKYVLALTRVASDAQDTRQDTLHFFKAQDEAPIDVLVGVMKSTHTNKILLFSTLLFGTEVVDLSTMTKENIKVKLKQWAFIENEMQDTESDISEGDNPLSAAAFNGVLALVER